MNRESLEPLLMDEEDEEAIKKLQATLGELRNDLYLGIGAAISHWSQLEGSLIYIASWLMDAQIEKVGLVFYSINNFHSWLSIIEELFEIDPAFAPFKPDWNKIAKKLKGLNDTRVRLAHHSLVGKDIFELARNNADLSEAVPTLTPNKHDVRGKWKKKSIGGSELLTFYTGVTAAHDDLIALLKKIQPIYLGPKQKRLDRIEEFRRKAALWDEHQKSGA